MNIKAVVYTLGNLLLCVAVALLAPLLIALYYARTRGEGDLMAFVWTVVVTVAAGLILRYACRTEPDLHNREGFAVVALGWMVTALFGALPFFFFGAFRAEGRGVVDEFIFCYFESMSGFSTTGATVLEDIEWLPHGILFWRSLTHWLGGMGIVVLAVAILPLLGVGGMQLYRAEAPGPQTDRLTPRIASTAKLMWGVYVLISGVEFLLLWIGGMTAFDAACHAFGTMATGGFATKNASIGHYDSVYFDVVITVFMMLAGTNFALHYRALRGDIGAYWRDTEFRFYAFMYTLCVGLIMWNTLSSVNGEEPIYDHGGKALQYATFQVAAIATTTGYGTADFEVWPALSQVLLVMMMFFGGCAGSTGGGMKHVRFLLLIKHGYAEIKRLIMPRAVLPIRLGDRVVAPDLIRNILGFFFLFLGSVTIATLIMAALGLDTVSAFTCVVATIFNIGPGLGTVGSTDNYAHIPAIGKCVLSFCMIVGRLELYTVLVLFAPQLWKR
ncbi:potassium transporter [Candidatus Poribacteria bacterium]|nr:potassium transporter [Candidatus Poribacteria bacterium]